MIDTVIDLHTSRGLIAEKSFDEQPTPCLPLIIALLPDAFGEPRTRVWQRTEAFGEAILGTSRARRGGVRTTDLALYVNMHDRRHVDPRSDLFAMSLDTQQLPIPGSIVIVDTDTDHNSSQSDKLVLSPTPSNDVNDPLRWSRLRKNTTMAMVMLCTPFR